MLIMLSSTLREKEATKFTWLVYGAHRENHNARQAPEPYVN